MLCIKSRKSIEYNLIVMSIAISTGVYYRWVYTRIMFRKSEIIKNYLRQFPNTASSTLAKKIYNENSEHFKSWEEVRNTIRYYRGISGSHNRNNMKKNSEFVVEKGHFGNPFNLPKSFAQKPKVFHFPKEDNNILVLADLHIPYHDATALTVALQYGVDNNINTILINGDLMDFYQISRFVNVERKQSVAEELEIAKDFLQTLRELFPNANIYFLEGNHDSRISKYLAVKAPELLDVEDFQLEQLLELDKLNIRFFETTTLLKVHHLAITHGDLLLRGFFSPVNSARGAFLKAKANVLVSHTHKISTHSETNINGKPIVCYSTGCLCELTPNYQPFANNYTHGFAHIKVGDNGFSVKNLQILNGEIIN